MKNKINIRVFSHYMFLMIILMMSSCKQDKELVLKGDFPPLTGEQKEYSLMMTTGLSSIGRALFLETENNSSVLSLKLFNLPSGTYQVMIREGSYSENGDLIISVGMLNTADGIFEAEISQDDQNNSIIYKDLIKLDAHIRITSQNQPFDIISDIGINELSGKYTTFSIIPVEDQEASGTIEIHERISGESMLRTIYENSPENNNHPVRLYSGSFNEGGELLVNLTTLDPVIGFSDSHVGEFITGESPDYNQLIKYDGHIKIHLSNSSLSIILAATELAGTAE